jgi:ubiquinone/menaquinone biosynthesis C-methylase UbiE
VHEHVLAAAELRAGEHVVDVGGLFAVEAATRVAPEGDVIAVIDSVDRLEELQRDARTANLAYQLGGAEILPLPDASADVLLADATTAEQRSTPKAADEFHRVLRLGGRVSAALDADERELEQAFARAGFVEVRVDASRDPSLRYLTARRP